MKPDARAERELRDLSVDLRPRVRALIEACPYRISITSAWRSRAEQQRLYDLYRAGKGNPANPPGRSKHETTGRGGVPAATAADLDYPNAPAARALAVAWVHRNAAEHGLHFPIRGEDWHVESNGRPFTPPTPPEDNVTADDIKAIAAAVRVEVQKDIKTVLRATDQPSIRSLDERLSRIEKALGSGT